MNNHLQSALRPKRRLPAAAYREGRSALLTFCARERGSNVLTQSATAGEVGQAIRGLADHGEVYVWCVMPDHVHAIVRCAHGTDLLAWVRRVKGKVAARARALGVSRLWQRSFHDSIIRREEDLVSAVRYVLHNPVRAGLVEHWSEWPHKGSLEWDLSAWV